MKTSIAVASALVLAVLSSSERARADLAPPVGSKRVSYQFTPTISGDTTGQVVFSYPCAGSNGTPGTHVTKLVTGQGVAIGNHEGCQIYIVAKDVYDAWAADAGGADAPAKDLVAQAKVCGGKGPSATHTVAVIDPRSSINDNLDVKVESGSCTVAARSLIASTPTDASSAPAAPEKKGGCNASGSSSFPLLLALPALVLLLKKRRG